jgi:hypothetical protein
MPLSSLSSVNRWNRWRGKGLDSGAKEPTVATLSAIELDCSQCGRPLPEDVDELERWRHGPLLLAGELDADAVALLLCPDCVEEEHSRAFDEGGEE